ncbi:MAG: hypothetical protein ABSF90_14255 [Syntrophobacteraceae bacterium]|jgi:hypothetical protein
MESALIQTLMNQYRISMQLMKVNPNKSGHFHPETRLDRYRCRISRPGKEINVYVAVPPEEGAITPSDVLFMLILDASGCEMFKDYYARQEEFSEIFSRSDARADGFDEFWLEYESRCEQTRKLRTFLGKNLYEKLINRFGFDN